MPLKRGVNIIGKAIQGNAGALPLEQRLFLWSYSPTEILTLTSWKKQSIELSRAPKGFCWVWPSLGRSRSPRGIRHLVKRSLIYLAPSASPPVTGGRPMVLLHTAPLLLLLLLPLPKIEGAPQGCLCLSGAYSCPPYPRFATPSSRAVPAKWPVHHQEGRGQVWLVTCISRT